MSRFAVSADIGSTWTKAVLVDADAAAVLGRAEVPTTPDDLARCFEAAFAPLEAEARRRGAKKVETFLSSSAKGGLRIAASGVVPELTAKAAALAAASAGGKVVGTFSYKLAAKDVAAMADLRPDVVLLSGGTDGGDESYVLYNARALAASSLEAAFVYAGNAAVAEEAVAVLARAGKRAVAAPNILPDLDRLEPEGARAAVARIFLERIVEGRGLGRVRARCAAEPRPTPAAVFDLVSLLAEDFGGALVVVDLGGATTDVYSACEPFRASADRFYRGIPEPRVKRTVEGDLGLRVNAANALEAALRAPGLGADEAAGLRAWAEAVSADPGRLPVDGEEARLDAALAAACCAEAVVRHAGRIDPVYTTSGLAWVQTGKDLGGVKAAIGTGGALSRGVPLALPLPRPPAAEGAPAVGRSLVPDPASVAFYRDADYLFPLAANLAQAYPAVARKVALSSVREAQPPSPGAAP